MEDYATLDRAKVDGELVYQMASGYFAALSGKVFEYRGMEQGDDKVCLWRFEFNTRLMSVGVSARPPSRLPTQMPGRGREGYSIRIGVGNPTSNGEDA
jgi:hypothetical protein